VCTLVRACVHVRVCACVRASIACVCVHVTARMCVSAQIRI
jgi:hypothetical protein